MFSVLSPKNLTYEIILTLGQAFEVAYQLALQAQRAKPLGAAAGEMIETKSSKPVPKPRAGMRKSAVRMCGPAGCRERLAWSELGFLLGTTCLNLPLRGGGTPDVDTVPVASGTAAVAVSVALLAVLLQR